MRLHVTAFFVSMLALAACGRTGADDGVPVAPCGSPAEDVPTIHSDGDASVSDASNDDGADVIDAPSDAANVDTAETPWWMRTSYYETGAETWIIATDLDATGAREVVELAPIPNQWHCRTGSLGGCIVTRHFTREGTFDFMISALGGFRPAAGQTCQDLVGTRLYVFNSSMGRPARAAFPVVVEGALTSDGFCRFTIRRDAPEAASPNYQDFINGRPVPWFLVVRTTDPVMGMVLRWDDGTYCSVDQGPIMFVGRYNLYYHMVCHGSLANRTVRVQFLAPGGTRISPCELNSMGMPQGSVLSATDATGGLIGRELRATSTAPDGEGWCTYILER